MTEGKPIALKMVGGHIEKDLTTKYWIKTSDDKLLIKSVINVIRWKECTGRSKVKTAGLQLLTAWHHWMHRISLHLI